MIPTGTKGLLLFVIVHSVCLVNVNIEKKLFLYRILLFLGCDCRAHIHFSHCIGCFLLNETRCSLSLGKDHLQICKFQ